MVAEAERATRPARTSVWLEGKSRTRGRRHERHDHRSDDTSAAPAAPSASAGGAPSGAPAGGTAPSAPPAGAAPAAPAAPPSSSPAPQASPAPPSSSPASQASPAPQVSPAPQAPPVTATRGIGGGSAEPGALRAAREPSDDGFADATRRPRRASAPSATAGSDPAGLDLDRITAVSVRLLDAEGPEKFSMRRLAAELGVTAMSLYWYVDTKDDLLELSLDHVFGEVRVPDMSAQEHAHWPDSLRALAVSYRSVFVRHPWASPLIGKYLNIGPCATLFSHAVQAVVRRTGLPPSVQMGAISAVFQFVYGFGTIEAHYVQRCVDAGLSQDAYYRLAMGTIDEQPSLRAAFAGTGELLEARRGGTVQEMRERDFEIALDLLVAGIEALRARMTERAEPGPSGEPGLSE